MVTTAPPDTINVTRRWPTCADAATETAKAKTAHNARNMLEEFYFSFQLRAASFQFPVSSFQFSVFSLRTSRSTFKLELQRSNFNFKSSDLELTSAFSRRRSALLYSHPVPVHLVQHPLVHDALATLRDVSTPPEIFRHMAVRISLLLASEATRDVPSVAAQVQTPLGPADARRVRDGVVVVPVLRAGLGMLDAVLELIPTARVGHIGLQRDEMTAIASQYYSKLPPDLNGAFILMIDPMLATGGSAVAALDLIRRAGGRDVRMICIVAAPEGIALVEQHHPDVHIYTPVVDTGLNGHKYIVPGLGDFGDRLYGT